MVKMKNMLFPLLMIMGIGSVPSMWALSGAERARIKLQLDKAFTANKFSQVKQLIETLRRGGEERIADEFELKFNDRLHALLNRLNQRFSDFFVVYDKVVAAPDVAAAGHRPGAGNVMGRLKYDVRDTLAVQGLALYRTLRNLVEHLYKPGAQDPLILDLLAQVTQAVTNIQELYAYLALAITKANDRRVQAELEAVRNNVLNGIAIAAAEAFDHDDTLKGAITTADLAVRKARVNATLNALAALNQGMVALKRAVDNAIPGDAGIQP